MKKALLILACLAAAAASYAQGTVNFNTRVSAAVQLRAFAADGVTGLTGANYTAQLWGGPANATEGQLQLVASSAFRTGSGAGWVNAGAVAVPGVAGGLPATFQLRAFDNTTGADYASATVKGQSALFAGAGSLGDPTASPPGVPVDLLSAASSGSFSLSGGGPIVPEPTTIALGVLGAAALFLRRRS